MENYQNTLLISPDYVKASTLVNANTSDAVIADTIREAQRVYLPDVIPVSLIARIQMIVYANIAESVTDDTDSAYWELLETAIQPYLAAKSQSLLCWRIAQKIRNAGVITLSDTNMTPATAADVRQTMREFETSASAAATRLSKAVEENAEALGVRGFRARVWVNSDLFLGSTHRGGRYHE